MLRFLAALDRVGGRAAPCGPRAGPRSSPSAARRSGMGESIPVDFTADGRNVSPTLTWNGAPPGTREFALILDDPDAPTPQPFVHWVIYKIPGTATGLPEGLPMGAAVKAPGLETAAQGLTGFAMFARGGGPPPQPGYRGPGAAAGQAASLHLQGLRVECAARGPGRHDQGRPAESDGRQDHRAGRAGRPIRAQTQTVDLPTLQLTKSVCR